MAIVFASTALISIATAENSPITFSTTNCACRKEFSSAQSGNSWRKVGTWHLPENPCDLERIHAILQLMRQIASLHWQLAIDPDHAYPVGDRSLFDETDRPWSRGHCIDHLGIRPHVSNRILL